MKDEPIIKEQVLEAIRLSGQMGISYELLSQMRINSNYDEVCRYVNLLIEIELYGEKKTDYKEVVFKSPATWFDHFKQTYFKGTLRHWFPVKYKSHRISYTFDHYAIFPDLNIVPKGGRVVFKTLIN